MVSLESRGVGVPLPVGDSMGVGEVGLVVRAAVRGDLSCRLRGDIVEVVIGGDGFVYVWGRLNGIQFVAPVADAGLVPELAPYPFPADLVPPPRS